MITAAPGTVDKPFELLLTPLAGSDSGPGSEPDRRKAPCRWRARSDPRLRRVERVSQPVTDKLTVRAMNTMWSPGK